MHTIDFSPLFHSTVGYDRIQRLVDNALQGKEGNSSYPPYNIETLENDAYRITMAVAGLAEEDLDLTVKENTLVISASANPDQVERHFLHRGIAGRAFKRSFELAEHIRVTGASLVNGLLHVDLVREVPEEKKPRKIEISSKPLAGLKKAA